MVLKYTNNRRGPERTRCGNIRKAQSRERARGPRAPYYDCSRPNWRFGSAPWYRSNGWPTPAGHKGRRTGRQPATRGARRASRSLHLAALAAPCSPYSSPRPSPTPRAFPAPAGCSWGPKRLPGPASGLPAGCLPLQRCVLLELCLPALSARALLQRVHPCSGPGQSGSSWGRLVVLGVPRVALGGSRNVLGGQDLNGRPVLSF